jgi:uncharacterized repeat protein (TIGR03803 family)
VITPLRRTRRYPAANLRTYRAVYGTDEFGGAYMRAIYGDPGCGSIFKITPTGQFTILYSFKGADGSASGDGTVFKITSTGMLTTL